LETATCPISNGNPDIVIDTDSSILGWGAVCNAVTAQGSFTPLDVYYAEGNINVEGILCLVILTTLIFSKSYSKMPLILFMLGRVSS